MTAQLRDAIARLRRAQPRNPDTMLICDAIEATFVRAAPKFDKVAYQREYMRKRRAAASQASPGPNRKMN